MRCNVKAKYSIDETLDYCKYGYLSSFGHSTVFIDCPVCGEKRIRAYVWSLYGGGKLCPKCKSKFGGRKCLRNLLWKGGAK